MTKICSLHKGNMREIGRELTPSYDKTPTPTEKSKMQVERDTTKAPPKTSIT